MHLFKKPELYKFLVIQFVYNPEISRNTNNYSSVIQIIKRLNSYKHLLITIDNTLFN